VTRRVGAFLLGSAPLARRLLGGPRPDPSHLVNTRSGANRNRVRLPILVPWTPYEAPVRSRPSTARWADPRKGHVSGRRGLIGAEVRTPADLARGLSGEARSAGNEAHPS
jgi:hypothetical protein